MTKEQVIEVLHELDGSLYETQQVALEMAIKALEQQPSEDCVSREQVWFMITGGKYPNEDYEQFIDRLVKELENLPPVTPTHQVGKWILIDKEKNKWQCSHCKELGKDNWWKLNSGTPEDNKMDYCPHCGAEMKGEDNNDKSDI